jgi:uncharacterized membrane protein
MKRSEPVERIQSRYPSPFSSALPIAAYSSPKPATWGILIALTLVAFLLRAPHLDVQSLWRDEVDVIRLASESQPQLIQDLLKAKHNGPLFYLIMHGWFRLAGNSEFGVRYLSLCCGALAVPLIYRVGRRLVGKKASVLAAALVAISPYLVWYSQDVKMYALVTALTLLTIAFEFEAVATGRLRLWVAFVVSASLALYIHILTALMIPVYGAILLAARPRHPGRWWPRPVAFGLLTLPYLPLAVWQWPLVLNTYQTGHPFYPINQILSLLFNLYARGTAMVGGWAVVAAFVFAILGALLSPPKRSSSNRLAGYRAFLPGGLRARFSLLLWLFLPVALVYIISLRAPVFEPRYLIYIAPAFYLLTGLGVVALWQLSRIASLLALAGILSFSLLGLCVQASTPIKSDFRAAASYVATHRQASEPILFQMPYVRHTFDYYFGGDYVALDGPWTNEDRAEEQVAEEMGRLVQSYRDVWLVASESWLWDSRDLARAWFTQHAQLVESAHFVLVDVYHYRLPD